MNAVREKDGEFSKTSSSGTVCVDLTGDNSSSNSSNDDLDEFATPMRLHDMQRINFNFKKLSDFCMSTKQPSINAARINSVCISILNSLQYYIAFNILQFHFRLKFK